MPSFLFSVLFIHVPSSDVLQVSGYFYVCLNLVTVPAVKILIKVVTLLYRCCCGKNIILNSLFTSFIITMTIFCLQVVNPIPEVTTAVPLPLPNGKSLPSFSFSPTSQTGKTNSPSTETVS